MNPDDKDKTITKLSMAVVYLSLVVLVLLILIGYIIYAESHRNIAGDAGNNAWCGVTEPTRNAVDDKRSAELFKKLYNVDVDLKIGEKLFKQNCSMCHRLSEGCLSGPGIVGVFDRVPSVDWVYHFILNSDSLIKSGDAYATKIFHDFNNKPMPAFAYLSKEQIVNIMAYIHAGPPDPPVSVPMP